MTVRILTGDCRDVLKTLPDQSVHCVVTSPPYWGLRDYGTAEWDGGSAACDHVAGMARHDTERETPGGRGGSFRGGTVQFRDTCGKCGARRIDRQIGLEQSPDEYVATMVEVFKEIWRVLRDDGCVFLNLGDAYCSGTAAPRKPTTTEGPAVPASWSNRSQPQRIAASDGLKPGDLIGIPWRVAFALQDDGWYLRQDNIWAKRNCMPESIRNCTTRAHEYMFQLTKSGAPLFWTHRDKPGVRSKPEPDYRWVHKTTGLEMAQMPADWDTHEHVRKVWRRVNLWEGHNYFYDSTAIEEDGDIPAGTRAAKGSNVRSELKDVNSRPPEYFEYTGKRNKRSVWWIATQPYRESHFAVMPAALVEPCILAGTSEKGCCRKCSAPWVRQTEKSVAFTSGSGKAGRKPSGKGAGGAQTDSGPYDIRMGPVVDIATTGWLPSCSCADGEPVPCTVLDPFGGAGTTALVCDRLQRDAILIELNADYAAMAEARLRKDGGLFTEVAAE